MTADEESVSVRLRGLVRDGGLIETAQVQVLGLEDVEAAAGSLWPTIRERVRISSIRLIESRLHKDDLVVPCGDGFLVVFAHATSEEIQAHSRRIREALVEFYLGEDGLEALRAEVSAQQVNSDTMRALLAQDSPPALVKPPRERLRAPKTDVDCLPVWSFRQQTPVLDFFTPTLKGRGCSYVGYDADFLVRGHHTKYDFLDHDLAVLDRALNAFDKRRDDASPRMMCVQVHATTMQNRRARERYMSWLPDAGDPFTQATILTIAEIARGTPIVSMTEWVGRMKTRFPRVILDFHMTDRSIGAIADAGAWGASVHLPVHAAAQRAQFGEQTLQHLQFWARAMQARRMRLLVHGFSDSTFYDRAATFGVDMGTMAVAPAPALASAAA